MTVALSALLPATMRKFDPVVWPKRADVDAAPAHAVSEQYTQPVGRFTYVAVAVLQSVVAPPFCVFVGVTTAAESFIQILAAAWRPWSVCCVDAMRAFE